MAGILRYSWIILIAILLNGCGVSKSFVYFEALQPASVTYPKGITKVGYLNRAPYSMNALSESNRKNLDAKGLLIIDTIVCNNLKEGFIEGRKSNDVSYLDNIIFIDERRYDTTGQKDLLEGYQKWRIFNDYDLDALISMEYYRVALNKNIYYDFVEFDYVEEFSFFMDILWRIYLPDSLNAIDEFHTTDTLYFINRASGEPEDYMNSAEVLVKGCGIFGYEYGQRQVPSWNEVARVVFRGGDKNLREAATFTDEGKWEDAVKLWKQVTEDPNEKTAAMGYHNLSVYYEIEDDISMALEMALEADKKWKNSYIEANKKTLEQRKKTRDKLFRQLEVGNK